MATNTQLKFYKVNGMPTSGLVVGAIYFDKLTGMINVATSASAYEKFGGRISETEWNAEKSLLSITKNDGSKLTLDFSDMASASAIEAKLATINTNITNAQKAADAAQADVDAVEEKLGDGFSKDSTVTAQLAAVKATADAAAVKATVDAELAKKADAEQVAKDITAAQSAAEATAAADATAKANKAKEDAIAEAVRLDGLMDARVDALEAAVGTGGSVDEAITAKIDDLDANVTSAEGTQVRVQVVEVDGKVTEVKVTESATFATAQDLADEIADRAVDEQAIIDRVALLDAAESGRVSVLEKQVAALNAATHFEGKVEFDPSAENPTTEGYQAGDIVIYGNKEYIFDGSAWIELGDTTAESNRISALEGLVGTTSVGAQIDAKIAALSDEAKSSEDANLVKVTVSQSNGNVTGVSVDDAKLDAKFKSTDDAVALNTAAVADYKTRIESLEATKNALDSTYVKVSAYNTDKEAFEKKHTDLQGEIDAAAGRLDTAEADIDGLQEDVLNLQAGTGLADGISAPVYTKSNYLGSATTLVAADMALDAKIKEVADSVTNKNVSAEGDTYVSATAVNNKVTVAAVTGTVESKSGLATNQGVYDALCWVEFA